MTGWQVNQMGKLSDLISVGAMSGSGYTDKSSREIMSEHPGYREYVERTLKAGEIPVSMEEFRKTRQGV